MAENMPPSLQLPPPPQTTAGAPGLPQLAPLNTQQQNNNPIPTAITSPMGENGGMMSPDSTGGFVRRAAPEPNKRALYVGGLDPRVTEDVLRQIFETTGHVQNVKIIPDKNVGAVSINFISVKSSSRVPAQGCVKFSTKRRFAKVQLSLNADSQIHLSANLNVLLKIVNFHYYR